MSSSNSELPPIAPAVIIDDSQNSSLSSSSSSSSSSSPQPTRTAVVDEKTQEQNAQMEKTTAPPPNNLQPRKPEIHYQQPQTSSYSASSQQPKSELERLLVDQIAACHLKDDEILSLEQTLLKVKKDLDNEREMNRKLKSEIGLLDESLVSERSARKQAQSELASFRERNSAKLEEFKKIAEEMSYFEEVKGVSSSSKTPPPKSPPPSVSNQVTSLLRAFMSLQLELVRTIKISVADFVSNAELVITETIFRQEQEEFQRIFYEFEESQRQIAVINDEATSWRREIESANKAIEFRAFSASLMLQDHCQMFGRTSFEYCSKAQTEWINVSSLYTEQQRRVAAQKLRQANLKLKKAQEESEEKTKTIDEAKRNYNLLKARFDVRTKEQAAKPSSSNVNHSMMNTSATTTSKKADTYLGGRKKNDPSSSTVVRPSSAKLLSTRNENAENIRPSTPPPLNLQQQQHAHAHSSTTTSSSTTLSTTQKPNKNANPLSSIPGMIDLCNETPILKKNEENLTNTHDNSKKPSRVFDFAAAAAASSSSISQQQHHQGSTTSAPTTPPPSPYLVPHESRRNSSTSMSMSTMMMQQIQNHQSVSGTQTPILMKHLSNNNNNNMNNTSHQQQPAVVTNLYNDLVSMVETIGEDHQHKEVMNKVSTDMVQLRKHISLLEDAIVRRDEKLNKIIEERNSLNKECDAIAAQCRLLEGACRFGAKKTAEQGAQAVLLKRMAME